jgi:hypothetical protein
MVFTMMFFCQASESICQCFFNLSSLGTVASCWKTEAGDVAARLYAH